MCHDYGARLRRGEEQGVKLVAAELNKLAILPFLPLSQSPIFPKGMRDN